MDVLQLVVHNLLLRRKAQPQEEEVLIELAQIKFIREAEAQGGREEGGEDIIRQEGQPQLGQVVNQSPRIVLSSREQQQDRHRDLQCLLTALHFQLQPRLLLKGLPLALRVKVGVLCWKSRLDRRSLFLPIHQEETRQWVGRGLSNREDRDHSWQVEHQ